MLPVIIIESNDLQTAEEVSLGKVFAKASPGVESRQSRPAVVRKKIAPHEHYHLSVRSWRGSWREFCRSCKELFRFANPFNVTLIDLGNCNQSIT